MTANTFTSVPFCISMKATFGWQEWLMSRKAALEGFDFASVLTDYAPNVQKRRRENAEADAVGVEQLKSRKRTWRVAADCAKSASVWRA
ncbi:hypothetical protein PR003_g16713 [Phytophthora rubi]|uniref:Uncharacterized protein n=1 Tax=Phytophthora rubi TaxID=129364 RepID=A0A6A4EI88_9STRA|nr:hypothetical protein PR003_g16713 [Phytophthora rubi]